MSAADGCASSAAGVPAPSPVHVPGWYWTRWAPYAQATVAGPHVLTCGIAPFDEQGKVVGVDDFEAQMRQVFTNLQAVLRAAGTDWAHVMRLQTFLVSQDHLPAFRALRSELFPGPSPASVLVVVSALAHPDMLIEIMCDAVRGLPVDQSNQVDPTAG
jgi:enamine deaminase RidA (YjgF/YER057c/UK114 family)